MVSTLIDLSTSDGSVSVHEENQVPSFTCSDTVTDSGASTYDDESDALKDAMKLIWAERENFDLRLKLSNVEEENSRLQEQLAKAKTDHVTILEQKNQDAKAASEAKEEANALQKEVATLIKLNKSLSWNLTTLQLKFDKIKTQTKTTETGGALAEEATVASQQTKIEQLCDKNVAILETARKSIEDINRINAKLEKKESELKDLQAKFAFAEAGRDMHRIEHSAMLDDSNARNAEQDPDQVIKNSLKEINGDPNNENQAMIDAISNLKFYMAKYITWIDVSDFRIYTCEHDHLKAIPDGQNSTSAKTKEYVAMKLFRDLEHDEEFMKDYNSERQYMLRHHRAHVRYHEGRGAHPNQLKKVLLEMDRRRGVEITYN